MPAPVLIIGASSGVGRALAQRLHAAGTPLHLAARNRDRLAATAAELGGAPFSICDATDPKALAAAVSAAVGDGGALAGLAYCPGSIVLKPLKRVTDADMIDAFRLNAVGAALAVQAAEAALRAGTGAVVLFSTVAASTGFPGHAVTAAAKGAVEALTRALAADLAPQVRVNCIAPSLLRTPLAHSITANEAMAKSIAGMHPLPRLGEAEDAAALAAFLLSPEASWITAQVIAVDGGRSVLRTRG